MSSESQRQNIPTAGGAGRAGRGGSRVGLGDWQRSPGDSRCPVPAWGVGVAPARRVLGDGPHGASGNGVGTTFKGEQKKKKASVIKINAILMWYF